MHNCMGVTNYKIVGMNHECMREIRSSAIGRRIKSLHYNADEGSVVIGLVSGQVGDSTMR